MRSLVIYHSADFDGVMSALVCRKYLLDYRAQNRITLSIYLTGWTYGDEMINPDEILRMYDLIYMVDISFPVDIMKKLTDSGKVVWIDHHITAINDSVQYGYAGCQGIRRMDVSACEAAWDYLYPNIPCPKLIQYLSAWDIFDKARFDWVGDVLPLQFSCSERYGLHPQNWFNDIDRLLQDNETCLEQLIRDGRMIYRYVQRRYDNAVSKYGFEVLVDNRLRGICMMSTTFSSLQFMSVLSKYDCCVVVNRKSNDLYNVSLYIEPSQNTSGIDFNAGEYMKTYYNGGGHKGAAGGLLNFEQFTNLVKNQKL